jgi:hypothetical protein
MKKILYILTAIMIFTSCRSIDKMIESGNYDQALRYGVDKLRGEKNKKTRYVKGLQKAYVKLNKTDLDKIARIKVLNNKNSMDRIVEIYQKIENRQSYVYPLLPLISEDGYVATIKIKDYTSAINRSMKAASEVHYQYALDYLIRAKKNNDKISARKAYSELTEAINYFDTYKDSYNLKLKAYELGQTNILIEPYLSGSNAAFYHTGEIISQLQLNKLNSNWTKYYTEEHGEDIDYVATIEVSKVVPGNEKERFNSFTETKEVNDGKIPLKSKDGAIVKDTMGNTIYIEKRILVTANVEELIREKTAQMSGKVVILDAKNNRLINTIPINVTYIFEDYSCIFRGDKRAITNKYNKRIKEHCAPFPTDFDMTTQLAHAYKEAAQKSIKAERLI